MWCHRARTRTMCHVIVYVLCNLQQLYWSLQFETTTDSTRREHFENAAKVRCTFSQLAFRVMKTHPLNTLQLQSRKPSCSLEEWHRERGRGAPSENAASISIYPQPTADAGTAVALQFSVLSACGMCPRPPSSHPSQRSGFLMRKYSLAVQF